VSLRDSQGRNVFAVTDAELQAGGRGDASYSDTKFLSQEGEWFLAGILDGIADGELDLPSLDPATYHSSYLRSHANGKHPHCHPSLQISIYTF
jgi:hypothetical protein